MKKLVSWLLAVTMLASLSALPAMAEESVIKESVSGFYYIEANGDQAKLSAASQDKFIQVDGLYFKDLNSNGSLDVYEDYRQPVEDRVADLLSQMNLSEKAGTLIFSGIGGKNGVVVSNLDTSSGITGSSGTGEVTYIAADSEIITSHEPVVTQSGVNYNPMAYQIQDLGVTTYIAAMTGTPKDQLDLLNAIQKLGEESRLGIPIVFSGDRSYNTWGGMIDMAHYAFGVAHDEELLYNLVSEYAKESVALGYHQVFHGYGNEIGSWYGDEVNYISKMSVTETRAYDDNGFNSHSKHYIARGGRSNFANAQSPANLWESWMVPWQAVIDAGTQWIMLNKGTGLTPGVQVYMDKVSMDYLRNELGYDGIACLDWPLDVDVLTSQTGITVDGVDISELDIEEIYALMLNVGVDAISAMGTFGGTDTTLYANSGFYRAFPDFIVKAVEDGLVTQECLDEHVIRILKNKFDLGIFEDPYSDWEEALALIGNETYQAEQTLPMTNEEIDALRRPEIIEMESQLMVESTILLKNENVLPLTEGVKLYVMSNNSNIQEADVAALGAYGTVVETMDEADYIIGHVTAFDENFDYLVEDAQAADKPIILIWEGTVGRNGAQGDPYLAQVDPCAAVLMQTYNNTPDHGSSMGAFYRYVTPSITADMLFGVKEPGGSTVFEIPLTAEDAALSWGDLQMDMGVDNATRLYMAMLARENPSILMPNNLGDVLYTTNFGMNYSDPADIELSLLTVPEAVLTVEVDGKETTEVAAATQTAGVPFEINFVAKNNGGDGHVTAQIMEGDTVLAEKFVAVDGGQFRVITMEITLDAGEHTISLGDMSTTIVVE
jgi:beta-glucosidase